LKRGVREALLKKRNTLRSTEKKIKEAAIRKTLFSLQDFKNALTILFYASFQSEADTIQCIHHAFALKKNVILPKVDEKGETLDLYEIKSLSELKPGYMGIQEPSTDKTTIKLLKDIDVVIIPGVGFDIRGNRLGYGFGYYDKLLSQSKEHITTIALAFEEQIIPKVPKETHDIKIDKIVTDKRVIECK
jgi:5-formyltetrahydrofolate cyclo-ligase